MTRSFSVYLDAVRFAAAIVVVLSHLAYDRFTRGDLQGLRDLNVGSDAVILFFVLSGVVIAYASERDESALRFAFNRLTRLYSVLVPALLLTVLLDGIGQMVDPLAYQGWWYEPAPTWEILWRGLSFSNQWLGDAMRLGSNGPLWSLSYEAAYYIIFGAVAFLRGAARLFMLGALAFTVGINVLLLMPPWLFGVLVWRNMKAFASMSYWSAWLAAMLFPGLYLVGLATGLPDALTSASAPFAVKAALGDLGFSQRFLWFTVLAAAFALHLAAMARLLTRTEPLFTDVGIRWLAGASFTIYALHYPVLQLGHVLLPDDMPGRDLTLLGLTLAICFVVAELTERRLKQLREFIARYMLKEPK